MPISEPKVEEVSVASSKPAKNIDADLPREKQKRAAWRDCISGLAMCACCWPRLQW